MPFLLLSEHFDSLFLTNPLSWFLYYRDLNRKQPLKPIQIKPKKREGRFKTFHSQYQFYGQVQ